jgi:hydroxyethylthiazole kinase-like uncharacterized protein yjeF
MSRSPGSERARSGRDGAVDVTASVLSDWPLPHPPAEGDKESRGHVLVIAGSREMPGAAILAAMSALRAGAGKLTIAVPASIASGVALAVWEAKVLALPETANGGLDIQGIAPLQPLAEHMNAVLMGPGFADDPATVDFVRAALPLFSHATVVLDALAMDVVLQGSRFAQPVILTPHSGEMAHLSGLDKADVEGSPEHHACQNAIAWQAVVVHKGARSCIAAPDGRLWIHCAHIPGLGTSGSGDVLAGLVTGLAARGAVPEQAAVWAVALHARMGDALGSRFGAVGYLARELAAEAAPMLKRMKGAHG